MNKKVLILLIIFSQLIGCKTMTTDNKTKLSPPIAKKINHVFEEHGAQRTDPYHWLRDDTRSDEEVIQYLKDENEYSDQQLSGQKEMIEGLYQEMIARLPKKDQSVPAKIDNYWYYSRYLDGQEYPIYARKLESLEADESIMLDLNQLAKGSEYYQSNYQAISPNHKMLGYSEDKVGRRKYDLYFKDLETGKTLSDVIRNTTGGMAWAKDNKTIFYTKKHPTTLLPYRVYRHELGADSEDVLVYEEKDNTFYTSISASTSKDYIFIYLGSTTTSEVLVLDASNPTGKFETFLPREKNHEYAVDELNGEFFILSNWQAQNFRILKSKWAESKDKSQWTEVIAHDPETLIYDFHAFKSNLAIDQRRNGIRHIKVLNLKDNSHTLIPSSDESFTMTLDFNPDQNNSKLKYSYTSLNQPESIYEYDVNTGKIELLKQDEVVGGYDSSKYPTKRLMVESRDGKQVPVSLVYKEDGIALDKKPVLVYAYGSYGSSVDPRFAYSRLSLLDRGFIFAIAHIRGSQAKGRAWYEDGKLLKKKNTFNDFIDVTKGLVKSGYGDSKKVFAMGGSAGGLLMGAVINQNPELYKGVVAAVPFVDVISTMMDEDIPLTTGEFEEWGNPKNKEYYDYMLSYSPYDQVKKQDYPNMLVTTGLHDSQVQYWEPAKWVARLRDLKTDDNLLIMRTNMDAGHGGASGRFQAFKETAEEYGFLLKLLQ